MSLTDFFNLKIKPASEKLDTLLKPTNEERVHRMLKIAGRHGVTNGEFANAHILRYGSCIERLRKDGVHIISEREQLPNGHYTSSWRYTLVN